MNKLEVKSSFTMYLIGFLAALSSFVMGYSHVVISQTQNLLRKKNNLTLEEVAFLLTLIISATNLGQIIGNLVFIAGPLLYKKFADSYGEAKAMIKCNMVIMCAFLLQLVQLKFAFLLPSRFFMGIMMGILASILPLYLNSIAPVSISGKIGSMNQLLTSFGVICAYSFGFILNDKSKDQIRWRILLGLPIIPCLLSIYSLKYLFPFDRIERHIEKAQTGKLQKYIDLVYSNAKIQDLIRQKTLNYSRKEKGEYKKQMLRYRIAMVTIASSQICGINGIFYYAKQLFTEITGGDALVSQKLMVGLAVCQAISTMICGKLIDQYGRKYLILRGQQTLIFVLGLLFVIDNADGFIKPKIASYLIIALLYIHVIVFNFSLGPVCIIYAAELIPNITPVIITLRICTFLVALTTNYLIHEFGIGQMFLMFGVLSMIAHYYLIDHLRETKGKSKPMIYQMFENDIESVTQEQKATFV